MEITNPDGTQARAVRRFAVRPERLWTAFVDPDDMAQWMWGGLGSNARADCDLRIGGKYSVYTDSTATADGWASDRIGRLGVYVDIVSGQRLVYTLHWDAPVGYNQKGIAVADEVLFVSIEANGDETVLEVHHVGIPNDGVSAEGHALGLGNELDTLAALLE